MKPHLSNDELLDRLYGLGEAEEENNRHLSECEECARRLDAFEARRVEAVSGSKYSAEVSSDVLAAQRRSVYARLEAPPRLHGPWAPAALAAGLVLAVGMFLYHPSQPRPRQVAHQTAIRPIPTARPEMTDEQLFSVVYTMEESAEPEAAAPIHALFEGDELPDQQ